MKVISLDTLKNLCNSYDDFWGKYPEHFLEGEEVLNYILEKLAENPELVLEK